MTRFLTILIACAALYGEALAACRNEAPGDVRYVVCEFHPATDDIRLFLNDGTGAPFGEFAPLAAALQEQGETLAFAMNAGMYHKDRSPVGLFVENGKEKKKISTRDGPGNFHLKPNGVFWIDAGGAHVAASDAYLEAAGAVRYATQSGPMLVIRGEFHPKFRPESTSRNRRNGVGVREDGSVVFAISDTAVTFHEFAAYFRNELKTPNALYLDGTISRIYAPELSRNDSGLAMGPVVGVVIKNSEEGKHP